MFQLKVNDDVITSDNDYDAIVTQFFKELERLASCHLFNQYVTIHNEADEIIKQRLS